MRVFVWTSYGDSTVYDVNSSENLLKLVKEINDVLESMGEEKLPLPKKELTTEQIVRYTNYIYANNIVPLIQQRDIDMFEYGTNFAEIKNA